ncbi:hypothetical protein PYR71_02270 [Rhizobium sp. MC63]|uniref:Uncharacterized protein n=1 Tax=Rhizobium mulingense TaxID=3031128 RepID=A0ACC6MVR1_9HYPH|nr:MULTISPECIES: hypothetical protein [unclassified Rhizobium]MDF0695354.1 hypothetical protein [Rhizobium sp. MC63]MEA3517282.1 hypothetical protein [Rhizobium sp. MJ31]
MSSSEFEASTGVIVTLPPFCWSVQEASNHTFGCADFVDQNDDWTRAELISGFLRPPQYTQHEIGQLISIDGHLIA